MKKILLVFAVLFGAFLNAQTPQKIEQLDSVMIDTKVNIPRKNSGKVVTTINREQLERSQGKSVAQILNEVSGIEINGSRSNEGQNLGYYVRGGRNRQVVIMVDGVQLNDPSQISNDYDLRLIPTETIERIEIIKGASSVLYGSGAATAVISITTLPASKKEISAIITSSVGTNRSAEDDDRDTDYELNEINNAIAISGTLGKWFYNANFSQRFADGLSAIAAPQDSLTAFESDVFNQYEGRANVGYKFTNNVSYSQFFTFGKFKAGFDDSFGFTDAENLSVTEQFRTGGQFIWKYKKGVYVFNDSFTWLEREIDSSFPTKFDTRAYTLDNYLTYQITKTMTGLIGFNYNDSSFKSFSVPFGEEDLVKDLDDGTAQFYIYDPYINFNFISTFGLNINAGARLNIHSNYGSHLVYNANPSYNFGFGKNNLKILGSYSTAYITPSLFQLYSPQFGNEELQPEENATIEGGIEFSTENNLRISALYFNRNEKNYIDFVTVDPDNFISEYQNIGEEFAASGVEIEVSKKFKNRFMVAGNYTYTKPDERFALRIPKSKANASVSYSVGDKSYVGLSYQYVGERDDTFFNNETFESEIITLDSFGTLDATASTHILPNMKIFINVSNILNEEYEELFRFQTRGRNVRVGFSLKF